MNDAVDDQKWTV